jgi:restriction endonuclease Mrr
MSKKIVLIDGKSLADYMIEYNVGVSEKNIRSKEVGFRLF